jgi:predicted amidohydrolase
MAKFKAACVQLNSGNDVAGNLRAAAEGVREAVAQGADFVALPEYVACLDGSGRAMRDNSHPEEDHPALAAFTALARDAGVWLLVGSLTIKLEDEHMANRSYLLAADGAIVARYDKIHMFDVTLPSGQVIRESGAYRPGEQAVVAPTPWGVLGMSVCYDLRFPQLYRALAKAGAVLITIPSSFQRETGRDHWHTLVRSRAIENACYVLAPAMCGDHPGRRTTYGHSLIVDPWGRIVLELGEMPAVGVAELDTDEVKRVRGLLPSLEHDRPFLLSQS